MTAMVLKQCECAWCSRTVDLKMTNTVDLIMFYHKLREMSCGLLTADCYKEVCCFGNRYSRKTSVLDEKVEDSRDLLLLYPCKGNKLKFFPFKILLYMCRKITALSRG